ncbi:hypothetical protein COF68_05105 [Bacillus toyonensis]|nr:hypothetical protein COF68_05105 [Bacillus toyonensis]
MEDNQDCAENCELCGHEGIRYEYIIVNRLTKESMLVGSECITRFTDEFKTDFYDTEGNLVTAKRLTKDKDEYLKKVLYRELDELLRNVNNDFYVSIVRQIKSGGKLSPRQMKYLKRFYDSLNDVGQQAFKMVIKVSISTYSQKEQMSELNWHDKQFIGQFMTSSQRDRYSIVLK